MPEIKAIPPGFHTVTPSIIVNNAAAAISFYKEALGAAEVMRMPTPDGSKIAHAEIRVGDSVVFVADEFPEIREEFERGIRDLMVAQKDRVSARQAHNTARNAWKEDPAADRRIREMEKLPPDQFHSPYRGQPEIYNRGVVLAFEKAIASAIGRSQISWTRGTNDNKSGGAILDVFVAAVQWATCVAWQCSAPPGAKPLKVRAEGLLRIVKGARRKK